MGKVAQAALRVNPDLPSKTHPKTDTSVKGVKFGLDIDTVLEFVGRQCPRSPLTLMGFSMGGNIVLKLGGEYGGNPIAGLDSVVAIATSSASGVPAATVPGGGDVKCESGSPTP
jgi:dienelactone hydrolase